jgi:hypothetical protein
LVDDLDKNKYERKTANNDLSNMSVSVSRTGVFKGYDLYKDITPILTPKQIMELVEASAKGSVDLTKQLPYIKDGTFSDVTMKDNIDAIRKGYQAIPEASRNVPMDVLIRTDKGNDIRAFSEAMAGKKPAAKSASLLPDGLTRLAGGEDMAGGQNVAPTTLARGDAGKEPQRAVGAS